MNLYLILRFRMANSVVLQTEFIITHMPIIIREPIFRLGQYRPKRSSIQE